MNLILIHIREKDELTSIVVGVADSLEQARIMILNYYGLATIDTISLNVIKSSILEKTYFVKIKHGSYYIEVDIYLEPVTLNKV